MKTKTTPKTPVHVFEPFPDLPWEFKVYSGFFKIRRMLSNPVRVLATALIVACPFILYYIEVGQPEKMWIFGIKNFSTAVIASSIITGSLILLYFFEFIISTQSRQDMISYLEYKLERTDEIEQVILFNERYKENQDEHLKLNEMNRKMYQEFLDDLIHYERHKKHLKEGTRAVRALRMEKTSKKDKKQEEIPLGV
jgi:hypothetical protein